MYSDLTPQDAALKDFLAEHETDVRHLLPAGEWPLDKLVWDTYSPEFTAYQLGQLPDGRWAKLHHFRGPDRGAPHSHPCQFESHILKGSYRERIYHADWVEHVLRPTGYVNNIAPDCIHQLTALPDGEAWTLVFTGPVVREWRHYPELAAAA